MEKDYGPIRVILMKAGKQSNGDVITYDVMKQMAVENATGSIPVYDCEDPVKRHIIGTLQVKPEIEGDLMIGLVTLRTEYRGKPYVIGALKPVQLNLPFVKGASHGKDC